MSEFGGVVHGAVLTAEALDAIKDIVRPFSLIAMREEAARLENLLASNDFAGKMATAESAASDLTVVRERIARGGNLTYGFWELVDRDGVIHKSASYSGYEPFPVGRLTEYRRVSVAFRSNESEMFPAPSEVQVSLSADSDAVRFHVQAHADAVLELGRRVDEVLQGFVDDERLKAQLPPFKVFIGHGADPQWLYLQRALQETYGFLAEAYESEQRAGYHTLVIVQQMVHSSSVAVVVMTGEDRMADGSLRARENVVHEVGFCQGALGIDRTIVLLEEGVSEPSNIAGLTQIRFARGRLIEKEKEIIQALEQRRHAHNFARA